MQKRVALSSQLRGTCRDRVGVRDFDLDTRLRNSMTPEGDDRLQRCVAGFNGAGADQLEFQFGPRRDWGIQAKVRRCLPQLQIVKVAMVSME